MIEGYQAPIHGAVWKRPLIGGAPRLWSACWLVLCLYAGLVLGTVVGVRWVLGVAGAWALGQGGLIWLTSWDPWFDNVLLAQATQWYRRYYEAG